MLTLPLLFNAISVFSTVMRMHSSHAHSGQLGRCWAYDRFQIANIGNFPISLLLAINVVVGWYVSGVTLHGQPILVGSIRESSVCVLSCAVMPTEMMYRLVARCYEQCISLCCFQFHFVVISYYSIMRNHFKFLFKHRCFTVLPSWPKSMKAWTTLISALVSLAQYVGTLASFSILFYSYPVLAVWSNAAHGDES